MLAACGGQSGDSADSSDSPDTSQLNNSEAEQLAELALRTANDCFDLKERFIDNWAESLLQPYRDGTMTPIALPAVLDDSRALTLQTTADAVPEQVSQTNLQETGVDEADYVKADSNGILYVAHQSAILIERAFPPSAMTQLAELDLGGRIAGIYLDEDSDILLALVNRQALVYQPVPTPIPLPTPVPGPISIETLATPTGAIAEINPVGKTTDHHRQVQTCV